MQSEATKSVQKKAVSGVKWSYLSLGAGRIISLIATAILARLLTPEQFGIVGYVTVAMTYFMIFNDGGLGSALIQRQDEEKQTANTVFTLNLLFGIVLSILLFISAPWIAAYFSEPLVTQLLRALSVVFIISPLGATHNVLLRKQLAYKRKIIANLAGDIGKGIAAISLALAGAGVWALVIGQIVGAICMTLALWVILPWRPKLTVDRHVAGELISYGSSILGIDMLMTLNNNIDYLIIGRILGSVALGTYTLAYRLPELLIFNFLWVISSVLFPAYSLVQKDRGALRAGFLSTLRYTEMILMPVCVGLWLSAESIVYTLYGDQWGEAIPIVQWLALSFLLRSIGYHTGSVYKAIGRPNIMVWVGAFNLATTIILLTIGARLGLIALVQAHLVASALQIVVRLLLVKRVLAFSVRDLTEQIRPALVASACMAFAVRALQTQLSGLAYPIQLMTQAAAGGALYTLLLWLLDPASVTNFLNNLGLSRSAIPVASGD